MIKTAPTRAKVIILKETLNIILRGLVNRYGEGDKELCINVADRL